VGLGGTYGCRCGILYVPVLGAVFYAGLLSLTSSSYPSPCSPLFFGTIVLGGGVVWSASRVLLCVRVRRHGAFVLWKWLPRVLLLFLGLLGYFSWCVCV